MEQTRPFDETQTYPAKPGIQIHHFSWALLGGGGLMKYPEGAQRYPKTGGNSGVRQKTAGKRVKRREAKQTRTHIRQGR